MRYGLIILGTVGLAAFAILLVNDPAWADDLHARALDVWHTVTKAMNDTAEVRQAHAARGLVKTQQVATA